MKQLIALITTAFALSAFAAEPAKPTAPATAPVVTATTPAVTAVKEDKKVPTKSSAKKDDKKVAPATAPTPAASK